MKISDSRDKKWGTDFGSRNLYTGRILESQQKKDRWKNHKELTQEYFPMLWKDSGLQNGGWST